MLNGYHIISELEEVLKSDHHKHHLRYDYAYWFVDEVKKLRQ